MTTTVIVKAHCVNSKEVHVITSDPYNQIPVKVLQDGETLEVVVFDERTVLITEVNKGESK